MLLYTHILRTNNNYRLHTHNSHTIHHILFLPVFRDIIRSNKEATV